jgi:FAD/FMN-containing dehydrogenase
MFLDRVDRDVAARIVDTLTEHMEHSNAMFVVTQLRALGGAMARVPADATAFGHRQARLLVNVAAMYNRPEDGPAHEAWASGVETALSSDAPAAAYVGFLGDEGEAGTRRVYPPATLERLADVKRRYDPDNLFRLNANVPPESS